MNRYSMLGHRFPIWIFVVVVVVSFLFVWTPQSDECGKMKVEQKRIFIQKSKHSKQCEQMRLSTTETHQPHLNQSLLFFLVRQNDHK